MCKKYVRHNNYELSEEQKEAIKHLTMGSYFEYDPEVISFIRNFYNRLTKMRSIDIYSSFGEKYSYYFANMLKTAFGRGEILVEEPIYNTFWPKSDIADKPFWRVIWMDDDDVAYDINGVYDPSNSRRLLSPKFLGEVINDFLLVPSKEYYAPYSLSKLANRLGVTDIDIVIRIYLDMVSEEYPIDYENSILEEIVYEYFDTHKKELIPRYEAHSKYNTTIINIIDKND